MQGTKSEIRLPAISRKDHTKLRTERTSVLFTSVEFDSIMEAKYFFTAVIFNAFSLAKGLDQGKMSSSLV